MTQKTKAELLRTLHHGPEPLILPNAWDALSARIVEAEGFPVIATSSGGCAAVLGYPDGQKIPRGEMIFLIAKIVQAVKIPVTADAEAGYDDLEQTALDLIAAGVAGLNLEDITDHILMPLEDQLQRIRTLRAVAEESGIPLVINARTDIYLAQHGDEATRFPRTVERLNACREAGADCLFVPGVRDAATIGNLVKAVNGPLNILAMPGSPTLAELKQLGVSRVSFGGGPSRVAAGAFRSFTRDLRTNGTFDSLGATAITYQESQDLLARRK